MERSGLTVSVAKHFLQCDSNNYSAELNDYFAKLCLDENCAEPTPIMNRSKVEVPEMISLSGTRLKFQIEQLLDQNWFPNGAWKE